MNPDKAVDRLEEDFDPYRQCPTLLDIGVADAFLQWLENNIEYVEHLEQARWNIGVLQRHVAARPDLQSNLSNYGVTILDDTLTDNDEALVMEMLRAYFGSNGMYRKAAQLLTYGRKRAEDGDDVQIISRLRSFRLIPGVQLYTIPGVDYKSSDEDAMVLRVLDALNLHPHVTRAAYERIMNGDYPFSVSAAVQALLAEFKRLGDEYKLPFVSEDKDHELVNLALKSVKPDTSRGKTGEVAQIQLNNFSTSSEWNEQKGYHDIMCGVVSAVRNPLSHNFVDEPFIRERFGDRRTALKFLCLLSLLFEKLDKRVAPR